MQKGAKMLTVQAVCDMAGVTRPTLARWIRLGLCPQPLKLGQRCLRFREGDIATWLGSGAVRGHVAGVVGFESAWVPDPPTDAELQALGASRPTPEEIIDASADYNEVAAFLPTKQD
jgi:predicted DNA-binding transcriptional regulator AlpA